MPFSFSGCLVPLWEMKQNKISKLLSDFNAVSESKSKVSKQLLLVEKEKDQYKNDLDRISKKLTLAQTTSVTPRPAGGQK